MSDFAFVRDPPERLGDLAAALGVTVDELFADGHSDMGHVIHERFSATYDWDLYHERPMRSAGASATGRSSSASAPAGGSTSSGTSRRRTGRCRRPDAVGVSTDVHMSHWVLAEPDGERLRIGSRKVDAMLGGWPTGPAVPGVSIPAAAVHHLGPDDVVRWVRID